MVDLGTWHVDPQFVVTAVDVEPHRTGGPVFEADSPMALTVLGPIVGPTAVLTLRTLALAGHAGPHEWHLADLASVHGVANAVMRHALDRLVRFHWLDELERGVIELRRSGNLSRRSIDRLHPALVDHYLGRSAAEALRAGAPTDDARLPLSPLLEKSGAHGVSQLARLVGASRSSVQAASRRGLSVRLADRYAVAAGLHPGEVWGSDFYEIETSH